MGITTKTGDRGETSLYSGERVSKDDARVEFCGTLDELCSFLGLARSLARDKGTKSILESIQRDLFTIGAEAATTLRFGRMLKEKIDASDVKRLEKIIKDLEKRRKFKECCFYLPGENPASSSLDIARTVTRRAERQLVSLRRKRLLRNDPCLIYLNRVSDLLYLLARLHDRRPRRVRR